MNESACSGDERGREELRTKQIAVSQARVKSYHFVQPLYQGPNFFRPRFWLPSSRVADFQMGPVCRERELKFWTLGLVDLATQYAIAFLRHDWPEQSTKRCLSVRGCVFRASDYFRTSQSDNDPRGTCKVLPSRRLNDWRLLFYLPGL